MHTDWPSAIGYEISSEMRFEVTHVYFAQHCFFFPPPHVPVGIQNATATSEKNKQTKTACIREIQVHRLWTKVYFQKGLTAMAYYLESNRGILSGISEGVSLGGCALRVSGSQSVWSCIRRSSVPAYGAALSSTYHVVSVGLHRLIQQLHFLVVQRFIMRPSQLLAHLPVSFLPA